MQGFRSIAAKTAAALGLVAALCFLAAAWLIQQKAAADAAVVASAVAIALLLLLVLPIMYLDRAQNTANEDGDRQ